MIETIPELPDHVLGFSAKGKVTADDYESIIIPAVEERFHRHEKIRLLYELGEEFAGFEAGALWDDTKLAFRHRSGWERVALVSDAEWIRVAARVLGLAIPGQVELFHTHERLAATEWIVQ